MSRWLIIGVGNRSRGDDAVGCLLAEELAASGVMAIEHGGEPASLIDAWQGWEGVILVDAVFSGAMPGTTHHFDLTGEALPASFAKPTTHAVGVAEAVELARALGKLPPCVEFYGVEGQSYDYGYPLTAPVCEAMGALKEKLLAISATCPGRAGGVRRAPLASSGKVRPRSRTACS